MKHDFTVRFAKNAEYVLYSVGIEVSVFEREYSLGKGFFSKIKNGSIKNITLDKAMFISGLLKYSIEDLTNSDMSYLVNQRDIDIAESEIQALQEKIKKLKGE